MPRTDDQKLKGRVKSDEARRHRLAAELRSNLKRRRDRARAAAKAKPEVPSTGAGKT